MGLTPLDLSTPWGRTRPENTRGGAKNCKRKIAGANLHYLLGPQISDDPLPSKSHPWWSYRAPPPNVSFVNKFIAKREKSL